MIIIIRCILEQSARVGACFQSFSLLVRLSLFDFSMAFSLPSFASGAGWAFVMTDQFVSIVIERAKHRLHDQLFISGATAACVGVGFLTFLAGSAPGPVAPMHAFQCHQMDRYVIFPDAMIRQILTNVLPESFEIRLLDQPGGKGDDQPWPIQIVFANIAASALVKFYEDFRPWLTAKLGSEHNKLPTAWRFARIVRNAASHGGVSINDKTFQPVSWKGLTYGPDNNGRQILGGDLSCGDLFVLMLEMNDELDQLGAPIEPPLSA